MEQDLLSALPPANLENFLPPKGQKRNYAGIIRYEYRS
jgi:hypothetical protein